MSLQQTNSTVSPKTAPLKKRNTNWHEAAVCAVQIDLQEYAHLLQFLSEYIFKTYNLFEIKGIGSSISTDSYYNAIGYVGLFINQSGKPNQ